jgi:hypothetical protein
MKRTLLLLLTVFGMSSAQAQTQYLGVGAALIGDELSFGLPLLSFQYGTFLSKSLELRGRVDTILFVTDIGVDLLYTQSLVDNVRGYVGGGVNLLTILGPGAAAAVHLAAGLEYRTASVGAFGDVQAGYSSFGFSPTLRAGVNFYF